MSILNNMHNLFRIDASRPASEEADITALKNYSPVKVPSEYLDIIREISDVEINVDDDKYLRIWGAKGGMEMNQLYSIQENIPGTLAIGDDEGEYMILYAEGSQGFGVYAVPFDYIDVSQLIYVSKSLEEMLVSGIGADIFNEL